MATPSKEIDEQVSPEDFLLDHFNDKDISYDPVGEVVAQNNFNLEEKNALMEAFESMLEDGDILHTGNGYTLSKPPLNYRSKRAKGCKTLKAQRGKKRNKCNKRKGYGKLVAASPSRKPEISDSGEDSRTDDSEDNKEMDSEEMKN